MAEENKTKFISSKLLEMAVQAEITPAYKASDVLNNMKADGTGKIQNVPVNMAYIETRTRKDGVVGTFISRDSK